MMSVKMMLIMMSTMMIMIMSNDKIDNNAEDDHNYVFSCWGRKVDTVKPLYMGQRRDQEKNIWDQKICFFLGFGIEGLHFI